MDSGYRVVFDNDMATGKDCSYMIHKETGRVIKSTRKGNVWVVEAFVDASHFNKGFARQG